MAADGGEGEFSRFSDCGYSPRLRRRLRPSTQAEAMSFRMSRANAWYSAIAAGGKSSLECQQYGYLLTMAKLDTRITVRHQRRTLVSYEKTFCQIAATIQCEWQFAPIPPTFGAMLTDNLYSCCQ